MTTLTYEQSVIKKSVGGLGVGGYVFIDNCNSLKIGAD